MIITAVAVVTCNTGPKLLGLPDCLSIAIVIMHKRDIS